MEKQHYVMDFNIEVWISGLDCNYVTKMCFNISVFHWEFHHHIFNDNICRLNNDLSINVTMAAMFTHFALQTQMHQSFEQEKTHR